MDNTFVIYKITTYYTIRKMNRSYSSFCFTPVSFRNNIN